MNNMKRGIFATTMVIVLATLLSACGGPNVQRISPDETKDLSGLWNDTDSRLVAEAMVNDCLSRPWYSNFQNRHHKAPAVIVGTIRNLSHEHISTQTFTNDMERALINSGSVEFVASKVERGEIRSERADQDLNASAESRKAMGQELGADYMLQGTINTIIDTDGEHQVRYYQVDLTLISLTDNRKVWIGQKKIKKYISNANVRF